jgi:mevalonate kinase
MKFNSKILLFGEYTVLHNSDALLLPFPRFSGELDFLNPDEDNYLRLESNKTLRGLHKFLNDSEISNLIDLNQLEKDIYSGLYFNSTIPVGYGLGSSGALIASIFSKYRLLKDDMDIDSLRGILAKMESFFHGSSSGLDPLVSYLDKSIYAQSNTLSVVSIDTAGFNPFLIDTGRDRSTQKMVKIFNEKCADPDFLSLVHTDLSNASNQSIISLMRGDKKGFFKHLRVLSSLQLQHFSEMIPVEFYDVWVYGLQTDNYYLKLCGAGGGGFILGFTTGKEKVIDIANKFKLKILEFS